MKMRLNRAELSEILSSFYDMNGIRVVIFDSDYNEIMAYPEDKCSFCRAIRSDPKMNALCEKSDESAFLECVKKKDIHIYKCHAGLVEAVKPLIYEGRIIGYIMFGQITDIKDKAVLSDMVKYFGISDSSGIKYKSKKQIVAAGKLLEICTEYIMLKDMIAMENGQAIAIIKDYIKENLSSDLNVDEICAVSGVGRTKLYKMFKTECSMGISQYINEKRLLKAKKLLKVTDKSVAEIASECGFYDYNYFSRVYKKRFGIAPRKNRS